METARVLIPGNEYNHFRLIHYEPLQLDAGIIHRQTVEQALRATHRPHRAGRRPEPSQVRPAQMVRSRTRTEQYRQRAKTIRPGVVTRPLTEF